MHSSSKNSFAVHFVLPEVSLSERILLTILRCWRLRRAGSTPGVNLGNPDALRKAAQRITQGQPLLLCPANATGILNTASKLRADMVFPTMLPLGRSPIPRVAYLFDFQHYHLPHLFSARIRRNRTAQFVRIAADADAIIVTSKAVANDITTYLGVPTDRILSIPYTPYALPWWFDIEPEKVQHEYDIDGPYLLICNHFWKHKDHATALYAFASLRNRFAGLDLQLVLTGDPIDHRDPGHYARLSGLATKLGIDKYAHFLGLIPKRDQLALLRGCAVLLQPTLFEGGPGGGSVYEAIGLGVPAVVSDIPVNREINQGNVRFFHAGDPADLAEKTAQVLMNPGLRPARDELLARGDANLIRLGNAITNFLVNFVNAR